MKTTKALDLIDSLRLTFTSTTESNDDVLLSVFARSAYTTGTDSKLTASIVHCRDSGRTTLKVNDRKVTLAAFKLQIDRVRAALALGHVKAPALPTTTTMDNVERDILLAKAEAMRRKAGCNRAYNPAHSSRVKAMMIGRADALESKAYAI